MKFQRKPEFIEAMLWDGYRDGATPIIDWIQTNGGTASWHPAGIVIYTRGIGIRVLAGMWVFRDAHGNFDACTQDVLDRNFDPLEES